jgi:hypothetical protein
MVPGGFLNYLPIYSGYVLVFDCKEKMPPPAGACRNQGTAVMIFTP